MEGLRPRRTVSISAPSFDDEEWHALRSPLEQGFVSQGPRVAAFEAEFAARHGVSHAVAVTSGTTALHLALVALGVGKGDEVIVPAFSFVASANAVLYCGATPVFVDVHPDTYNIDASQVASAVTPRTRAVMAVHLFGLCADIDEIRRAVPDSVALVEDAACAAGAAYKTVPAGGLGDVGCFSFHPRKPMTTGEGGMLTTNDGDVARRARALRNHGGSSPDPEAPYLLPRYRDIGFNYRMTDLQGAIGVVQLRKLDRFIDERQEWADWYRKQLAGTGWLQLPERPPGYRHAWQAFVAVLRGDAPSTRDDLMRRLHEVGVATRAGTHAITELDVYRDMFGLRPGQFPVAAMLHEQSVALPLHNRMAPDDFEYVLEALTSP